MFMAFDRIPRKKLSSRETGTVMLINLSSSLFFYKNKNSPVSSQNISVINSHQKL